MEHSLLLLFVYPRHIVPERNGRLVDQLPFWQKPPFRQVFGAQHHKGNAVVKDELERVFATRWAFRVGRLV